MVNNNYSTTIAFLDLLFNMLLVFVALFLMAILLINPPQTEANIEQNIEYIVTIRWSPESRDDVDLWATDGTSVVSYLSKQSTNMFLTRDDIGPDAFDNITGIPVNEESISFIAKVPGIYTVNIHLFTLRGETPLDVSWVFGSTKPRFRRLANGTRTFSKRGQEITLLRFEITDEGKVVNIDTENHYPWVMKSRRGVAFE